MFVVAPTPLNMLYQVCHIRAQVDHQVGIVDNLHHLVEEFHIGFKVALAHVAHVFVGGGEHIHPFEDRAVLHHGVRGMSDAENIFEPLFEKIHLKGERPSLDVAVIVLKIGIIIYRLKARLPSIMVCQHLRERGFAAANVACYGNVFMFRFCAHFLVFLQNYAKKPKDTNLYRKFLLLLHQL